MSQQQDTATSAQAPSQSRTVGQGALFIALGKIVFLVAGATINFVLPRLLSKADYGNYGVVVRLISLLNMMTVIGLLQSVSKLVAEKPEWARLSVRRGLSVAGLAAVLLAVLYSLASPFIAQALRDPSLVFAFRISAFITVGYALYAVAMGSVNGLQRFKHQALLDMGFSLAKVSLVLLGAAAFGGLGAQLMGGIWPSEARGFGAAGAVAGFAVAAALMATVSRLSLRHLPAAPRDQAAPWTYQAFAQRLLLFAGAVMLYQGALNGLMSVDLLLVKRHYGLEGAAFAGIYNAAVNVAQLPYFGVLAITFVAFPLISASTLQQDREALQGYVATAFRYGALIAVAVSAVVAASATDVLALIFPKGYEGGGLALSILVLSYASLALHAIVSTILNAAGRPLASFAATVLGLLLAGGLAWFFIPRWGLPGAAGSSLVGALLALLLSLFALRRYTASAPRALSSLRIVGSGLLIAVTGFFLPARGVLWLLPFSLAAGLVFVLLLVVTRELGRDDLDMLRQVLRRGAR